MYSIVFYNTYWFLCDRVSLTKQRRRRLQETEGVFFTVIVIEKKASDGYGENRKSSNSG